MSGELRAALERAEAEHSGLPEGWFHVLLATLGGAVAVVLSFAPWNFFPLTFIALIPVLAVTRHVTDRQGFRRAWLFGILTNIGGFPWVAGLVVKFGGMSPAIGVLLLLLLAMHQGLVPGIAFWLSRKVERGFGWRHGYALPLTYVFAEFLVPIIFPWRLGHSQVYHLPFLQLAELGGVHLMTFIVVLVNVALFDWIRRVRVARQNGEKSQTPAIVYAAIILFCLTEVYGVLRVRSVEAAQANLPTLRVGLVEGDIEIEDKWDPYLYDKNLFIHQQLSLDAIEQGAELLVWSESAYTQSTYHYQLEKDGPIRRGRVIPHDVYAMLTSDEPLANTAQADARKILPAGARDVAQRGFDAPLLTGTTIYRQTTPEEEVSLPPRGDGSPRKHLLYNSSILLDRDGRVEGMAHKYTLMPISERIPGADWVWTTFGINLYAIVPESGLFGRGDGPTVIEHQASLKNGGEHSVRIGMLNCYEDLMPGFVRKMGKQKPEFLLNQSNDAWFGRHIEPDQHMALAVPRAVEARTWLVRSTNTGVSSFIDASGRVRDRTSVVDAEVLVRDVPLKTSTMTPYRLLGEWVVVLCGLLIGLGLLRQLRQRRLT